MTVRAFSLDELIDGEIETIMYTCAPQTVKDVARKRLVQLRAERNAARENSPPANAAADHHCIRCGGHGYPVFSADQTEWPLCECVPFVANERKGEAA